MSEKKIVIVEPSRLEMGLWGYAEGDISRSYSADVFGMHGKIRRPFLHGAFRYSAMGTQSKGLEPRVAEAFPLLPFERAAEFKDREEGKRKSIYTGREVSHKGVKHVFGDRVTFQARDFTAVEIMDRTRRMYAYGGLFAAEAGTYSRLVADWADSTQSELVYEVLMEELERGDLPQSREGMRKLIESGEGSGGDHPAQMTLF